MPEIISLEDCSFAYQSGGFKLDDISMAVHPGKMYGVVGPNGSGKSTLLRVIAGLIKPVSGKVKVKGKLINSYNRVELARELAFLPQQPASSFDLTVRETVCLGRYPYQSGFGLLKPQDQNVIEWALAETECGPLANRLLSTLSGGEKQRVMIASILAQEPAVLLLDEPGSSLDIHHKAHVFALLRQLSHNGIAVATVTHDLNTAAEFCDHLFLIGSGRLINYGTPATVMNETSLSQVYKANLRVAQHPLTGNPLVSVIGDESNE